VYLPRAGVVHAHSVIVDRRTFCLTSGFAAFAAACGNAREPLAPGRGTLTGAGVQDVLDAALTAARKAGATYADARVVRRQSESLTTNEDHLVEVAANESYGIGVRVLAAGAWGFSASSAVTAEAARAAAQRAVAIAQADAKIVKRRVELAPVAAYHDVWSSRVEKDPFAVPLAEKAEFLLSLWGEARAVPGIKFGRGTYEASLEWKIFASSDGSVIEQSITRVQPGFEATAVDAATGEFEARRHEIAPRQAGWEYVASSTMRADARKIAEDAVEKLKAPSVVPGKRDVILAPSNLWLVIHESVGHPTELDRALGYEANFAGTSFATVDKLGKLKYAADGVTIYADKTTAGGLATCGYDDDGVKTQRWDLVKDGLFVGYQTTRDQAAWIGEKASRGASYAQDYRSFPFQRMPNVSLAPAKARAGGAGGTIDDIVAQTEDGVLLTGDGSWSIDHQRYNFQFGNQMAYEVKQGKVTHALRDVAYQSNTLEFWRGCDLVGGADAWRLGGALHDGKGEPPQSNAVSHGCPPARFKQVNVVNTNARKRAT